MFQYIHKKRTENNKNQFKSGEGKPKDNKVVQPPSEKPEGSNPTTTSESVNNKNPLLSEELKRIKNIMRQVI